MNGTLYDSHRLITIDDPLNVTHGIWDKLNWARIAVKKTWRIWVREWRFSTALFWPFRDVKGFKGSNFHLVHPTQNFPTLTSPVDSPDALTHNETVVQTPGVVSNTDRAWTVQYLCLGLQDYLLSTVCLQVPGLDLSVNCHTYHLGQSTMSYIPF